MSENLQLHVESTTLDAETIKNDTARIHATMLDKSPYIDAPNFTRIHPDDLELAFDEYDRIFFAGAIKEQLDERPLHFSFSNRMTSTGGRTERWSNRDGELSYEIKLSTVILFGCFAGEDHRPISVCGIPCCNRLDALQRIMEHEIVHLIEMRLWHNSSCAQPRFQSITRRLFGHTERGHRLITPREKAIAQSGVRPGMTVRFRFDGVEHQGVVNRITKRATVLVEDRNGAPYSNGKRYEKYYIPVSSLEVVE